MSQRREWDREQEPAAAWSVLSDRLTGLRANPETNYALYSEISPRFLGLMVAAMMVSFHKYGKVEDAYPERVNAAAHYEAEFQSHHSLSAERRDAKTGE